MGESEKSELGPHPEAAKTALQKAEAVLREAALRLTEITPPLPQRRRGQSGDWGDDEPPVFAG